MIPLLSEANVRIIMLTKGDFCHKMLLRFERKSCQITSSNMCQENIFTFCVPMKKSLNTPILQENCFISSKLLFEK